GHDTCGARERSADHHLAPRERHAGPHMAPPARERDRRRASRRPARRTRRAGGSAARAPRRTRGLRGGVEADGGAPEIDRRAGRGIACGQRSRSPRPAGPLRVPSGLGGRRGVGCSSALIRRAWGRGTAYLRAAAGGPSSSPAPGQRGARAAVRVRGVDGATSAAAVDVVAAEGSGCP
ncbi:MAG: hypothetical protein ACLSVD_17695, partial [Eggerthellaceae bacterium]